MARDGEHKLTPAAGGGPVDEATGLPVGLTGADARLAPGFVHVDAHPDHGEPVVYTPGELLPDFVLDALAHGGSLAVVGPGRFRLLQKGSR
jgi:hypothetical protein